MSLTGHEASPEKLEVPTVQIVCRHLANIIDSVSEVLKICHAGLPRSPQLDQMREGGLEDQTAVILGNLEVLVNDKLPAVSTALRAMSSSASSPRGAGPIFPLKTHICRKHRRTEATKCLFH